MSQSKSPFEHKFIRRKPISLLANSTHYLLDRNKEIEDINNYKSNTFYLDSNHHQNNSKNQIEAYIDSLIKNKISEQKNQQISSIINNNENNGKNGNNDINNDINDDSQNQLLTENEINNNSIMIKYKELEEENKTLMNTIKKNELTIEEQNGVILLLKTNIENDFFKNNDIKKYITIDNIVDFITLKNENEQYKKELVLSQALVNSLQSENQQLIKEKDNLIIKKEENKDIDIDSGYSQNSELINIEKEDSIVHSEKNMDINLKENNLIKELTEENKQLKKLIQEATVKLNYLLINEKNNKLINDTNNILNIQLNNKNNIIREYEEKLDFFNSYISEIKSSFINMQNKIIKHINIYNKMANDDLNSLLSNSFSQNLMKLSMKIGNLNQIEQYNLESKPEIDIHGLLYEFLSAINDEFLVLYEKVFQTNNYYKESNNKINELEKEINENKNKYINNSEYKYSDKLINDEIKYKNEYIKTINKLNLELSLKENENYYLKEISNNFQKDLEENINIFSIFIKIFSDITKINNKEMELYNFLNNYVNILKNKINLMIEKEKTIKKIYKNNNKIKNLKLDNNLNNYNNLKYYKDEYIINIEKDFDKKIQEKKHQLFMNKEKLNLLMIKTYKSM